MFLQSRSYDQKLDPKTEFLLCKFYYYSRTTFSPFSTCIAVNSGDFEEVTDYQLLDVEEDCSVVDFGCKFITQDYEVKAGYGFYEFVDPEYIGRNKRVVLIDKVCPN